MNMSRPGPGVRHWGELLHSWRYQAEGSRDLRIDLLRGFCVFAMIVAHTPTVYPLRAIWIAYEYILGAEAFVLLAGMLGGLSGLASIERGDFGSAVWRNLRRALRLYLLVVILTILVAAAGSMAGLPWAAPATQVSPGQFLWQLLTMQVWFWTVDILLLYTVLLLATPPALWLLARGMWWLLLAGSWGLWLGYQLAPTIFAWPLGPIDTFQPALWQIYYFHGLALGYYLSSIRNWLQWRRISAIGSAAIVLLMLIGGLFLAEMLGIFSVVSDHAEDIFVKFGVGPGRLFLALVTFPGAWVLITRLWQPIWRATGWFFVPLGHHALVGYVLHLPLIVAAEIMVFWHPAALSGVWVNRIVPFVPTLLVWLMIVGATGVPGLLRARALPDKATAGASEQA